MHQELVSESLRFTYRSCLNEVGMTEREAVIRAKAMLKQGSLFLLSPALKQIMG